MSSCYECGNALNFNLNQISRTTCCIKCDRDVRCCKNCRYYHHGSHNDCNESQAERVLDKERANFCDYFKLNERAEGQALVSVSSKQNTLSKLDDLFKK